MKSVIKNPEFDAMESSVRLTNEQVGTLYNLLIHPVIECVIAQEAARELGEIASRIVEAINADIEAYEQ